MASSINTNGNTSMEEDPSGMVSSVVVTVKSVVLEASGMSTIPVVSIDTSANNVTVTKMLCTCSREQISDGFVHTFLCNTQLYSMKQRRFDSLDSDGHIKDYYISIYIGNNRPGK